MARQNPGDGQYDIEGTHQHSCQHIEEYVPAEADRHPHPYPQGLRHLRRGECPAGRVFPEQDRDLFP